MNEKRKKLISVFLVFSLVALSGNLMGRERKGAKLSIQKKDGQKVMGELVTVKPDSLLLLDSEGVDVSVDIKDVESIKIIRKSKALELGLLGALGGAAAQGLIQKSDRQTSHSVDDDEDIATQTHQSFLTWGAIVGGVGLLLGIVIGMDKKIQLQGKSDTEINAIMEKLSKKARIRNFQ